MLRAGSLTPPSDLGASERGSIRLTGVVCGRRQPPRSCRVDRRRLGARSPWCRARAASTARSPCRSGGMPKPWRGGAFGNCLRPCLHSTMNKGQMARLAPNTFGTERMTRLNRGSCGPRLYLRCWTILFRAADASRRAYDIAGIDGAFRVLVARPIDGIAARGEIGGSSSKASWRGRCPWLRPRRCGRPWQHPNVKRHLWGQNDTRQTRRTQRTSSVART